MAIGPLECRAMRTRPFLTVAVALAGIAACAAAKTLSGPGVLYEGDSPFNHLVVEQDSQGVRRLLFEKNGAVQSAIKPEAPLDLELPYARAAMLSLVAVSAPKKVLIIGLGGGAMPMFLRTLYPEVEIEVVDIDPEVVKVAKKFFAFKEDKKLKATVADGRGYVEKAKGGWDLVFLDAYGKGEIPRHLATLEFLKTLKSKLAPGGLVVGNVWEPDSNPLYAPMVRTYQEAFTELCAFTVLSSGNRIFFAGKPMPAGDKLVDAAAAISSQHKLPFELSLYAHTGCLHDDVSGAELMKDKK